MGTIYVETFYSKSENIALFQSCPYKYAKHQTICSEQAWNILTEPKTSCESLPYTWSLWSIILQLFKNVH